MIFGFIFGLLGDILEDVTEKYPDERRYFKNGIFAAPVIVFLIIMVFVSAVLDVLFFPIEVLIGIIYLIITKKGGKK